MLKDRLLLPITLHARLTDCCADGQYVLIHYAFGLPDLADGMEKREALAAFFTRHIRNTKGLEQETVLHADVFGMTTQARFTGMQAVRRRVEEMRRLADSARLIFCLCGKALLSVGVCLLDGNPEMFDIPTRVQLAVDARLHGEEDESGVLCYREDRSVSRWVRGERLSRDFPGALRAGQLHVYLQPIWSMGGSVLAGAEALVRWQHPALGFLEPAEFITGCEYDRSALQLDFYMLASCCRLLQKWQRNGWKLPVISVNFSRLHAQTGVFMPCFLQTVGAFGIDPGKICVEWTERAFSDDSADIAQLSRQLREKGFHVAVDDFGTGASSLENVLGASADIVKLDKSFLAFPAHNARMPHIPILKSVFRVAKELSCQVIAEGVEEAWQGDMLREMGCPYVQGFFYGRPMPADAFAQKFLASGSACPSV